MYLSWAAFYEGNTDAAYLDVLLPRLLDDILLREGVRPITVPDAPAVRLGKRSRTVEMVAAEICAARDAFHLIFINADTGGRSLQAGITRRREAFIVAAHELCGWPIDRAISLSPKHELEAWALVDGPAVCRALGYSGSPESLKLPATPAAAEGLIDPKAELTRITMAVAGRGRRRGHSGLLTTIAQEQSLAELQRAESFQEMEGELRTALQNLGCLPLM